MLLARLRSAILEEFHAFERGEHVAKVASSETIHAKAAAVGAVRN
jgi:hypothetical protein